MVQIIYILDYSLWIHKSLEVVPDWYENGLIKGAYPKGYHEILERCDDHEMSWSHRSRYWYLSYCIIDKSCVGSLLAVK